MQIEKRQEPLIKKNKTKKRKKKLKRSERSNAKKYGHEPKNSRLKKKQNKKT